MREKTEKRKIGRAGWVSVRKRVAAGGVDVNDSGKRGAQASEEAPWKRTEET